MPAKMGLTIDQISAIEIAERVSSILSLLGAAFVIGTFMSNKSFHKPINRLVFYAAWGNIMANTATLISVSGIHLGINSPLCQFQAFLIQWYVAVTLGHGIVYWRVFGRFLPADALWIFAMAFNVYLTFFQKYDARQIRSLEPRYLLICYGTPFIPALAYFFIRSDARGKIYGPAVVSGLMTRTYLL
jgi:hypothetical protein